MISVKLHYITLHYITFTLKSIRLFVGSTTHTYNNPYIPPTSLFILSLFSPPNFKRSPTAKLPSRYALPNVCHHPPFLSFLSVYNFIYSQTKTCLVVCGDSLFHAVLMPTLGKHDPRPSMKYIRYKREGCS